MVVAMENSRQQRSLELAKRLLTQLADPTSQPPVDIVFFEFDRLSLGLPADRVRYVLPATQMVGLPGLARFCEGIIVKGEHVLPVFSPWPRLEPCTDPSRRTVVWIQGVNDHPGEQFGWLVDSTGPFYRQHEIPHDLQGLNLAGVPSVSDLIKQTTDQYRQFCLEFSRK